MEELALTKELYQDILNWMLSKYSHSTINNRKYYLKKIFKKYELLNKDTLKIMYRNFKHPQDKASIVMINNYCLENNIDFNINVPRMKYKKPRIPELLSASEIELMIKSAPKPYDLAIRCIFNMGAGLRISEIIKMSWNDIRWIDWLRNQKNYGVITIKQGKGGKDRVVNIPSKLMKDLYEYAKEKGVLNEFRVPSGSFIFSFGDKIQGKNAKFLEKNKSNITDVWKETYIKTKYNWFRYNILQKYCEKALNKKLNIHQLRHSRATYLYEYEKVDLASIQKLLGHASMDTTMRYIQVNLKRIFDSMNNTMEL